GHAALRIVVTRHLHDPSGPCPFLHVRTRSYPQRPLFSGLRAFSDEPRELRGPGGTPWHRTAWLIGWGDMKRYEVTRGVTKPPDFSSDGSGWFPVSTKMVSSFLQPAKTHHRTQSRTESDVTVARSC